MKLWQAVRLALFFYARNNAFFAWALHLPSAANGAAAFGRCFCWLQRAARPILPACVGTGLSALSLLSAGAADFVGPTNSFREQMVRGAELFRMGQVQDSVSAFDKALLTRPAASPFLWQRGISLYYSGRYDECAAQFAEDLQTNPSDAEEYVWGRMCELKSATVPKPKSVFTPLMAKIHDRRPVMNLVLSLLQRDGVGLDDREELLTITDDGSFAYFYARLYLALYSEASEGDCDQSRRLIEDALKSRYASSAHGRDYMVAVARVHQQRLLSGKTAASSTS